LLTIYLLQKRMEGNESENICISGEF